MVTKDGAQVITRFPAEDLVIAGKPYYTVGGTLPLEREVTSDRNTVLDASTHEDALHQRSGPRQWSSARIRWVARGSNRRVWRRLAGASMLVARGRPTGAARPRGPREPGVLRGRPLMPRGGAVTLRDVALLADVHPGTVSRALNPATRSLVNSETAKRVMDAAAQLDYRPNPIARGLKTNRSFTVGVLVPDLTNPLFPPIVRGIQDRLEQAGYTPLIANTDNDPERERTDFEAMRARQVDGVITATARLDHGVLDEMAFGGFPIVLVNRRLEDGAAVVGHRRRPSTARGWR